MPVNAAPAFAADAARFPAIVPAPATTVALQDQPEREALLFLPASKRVAGLAVELHGSGLDPMRQYRTSRLADRLTGHEIAVLLPQAAISFQLRPQLSRGHAWNVPGTPLPGQAQAADADVDDIDHVTRIVRACRARLNLHDGPLFLVGYSGGARLASHLLVAGSVNWAAAGLVAGLRAVEPARVAPPPTISFHGLDDPINPFAGGAGPRWDESVEVTGRRYALSQGCAGSPRHLSTPNADIRVFSTSQGADMLTTYTVTGAAHAWPGTRDKAHLRAFGPAGDGVDTSALITDFLVCHMGVGVLPATQTQEPKAAL